jgi:hypothetical protein
MAVWNARCWPSRRGGACARAGAFSALRSASESLRGLDHTDQLVDCTTRALHCLGDRSGASALPVEVDDLGVVEGDRSPL